VSPPGLKVLCLRLVCNLAADQQSPAARSPDEDGLFQLGVSAQRLMQELVSGSGAMALVLRNALVDDNNPYGKEWAVLAVRLLSQGHQGVQAQVEALQPRGVANPDQLRSMGLDVQLQPADPSQGASRPSLRVSSVSNSSAHNPLHPIAEANP
jgi:hypothetical protein